MVSNIYMHRYGQYISELFLASHSFEVMLKGFIVEGYFECK